MGNCLVTKLNEVINNNNLEEFDSVTINGSTTEDGAVIDIYVGSNIGQKDVVAITPNVNITVGNSVLHIYPGNGVRNFKFKMKKYYVESFSSEAYGKYYLDLVDICKLYKLNYLNLTNSNYLNNRLSVVANSNVLGKEFILSNNTISGDLALLVKIPSLEKISLNYCNGITGDLALIKDMPNLKTVTLDHTFIAASAETITYMRNRDITVTHIPYE